MESDTNRFNFRHQIYRETVTFCTNIFIIFMGRIHLRSYVRPRFITRSPQYCILSMRVLHCVEILSSYTYDISYTWFTTFNVSCVLFRDRPTTMTATGVPMYFRYHDASSRVLCISAHRTGNYGILIFARRVCRIFLCGCGCSMHRVLCFKLPLRVDLFWQNVIFLGGYYPTYRCDPFFFKHFLI